MAVFDLPAMMDMMRQDELQKAAFAEAQRKQAMEEQPDVDFTFEKGGLKVKGKLKDLPKLSQDPTLAPYLQGIGTTLTNEQMLENEEIEVQREELNDRLRKIASEKMKQELEIAKGDTRAFRAELGLGALGLRKRSDIMKELEAERGVVQGKLAELSFDRQAGQMTQPAMEEVEPAAPITPAMQATQPTAETIPSFNSAAEARAAGIKPGQKVIIRGQRGTLQPVGQAR
jgi:hypothetical protein